MDEQGVAAVHFKLDCVNCFIAGSFAITGRLSVKLFVMVDLVLSAAPQDFVAELEMAAAITGFTRPDELKWEQELFNAPIPGAGITVPGILNLGATVKYQIGGRATFSGGAQLNFGLKATIPNGAQIAIDTQHSDQSGATGWEGARLDPLFDVKALDASLKLAASTQPMLIFGVEIVKIAQFDVELILKLPQVQATLDGIRSETGACPGDPSKTGVSLKSDVDIELDVQVKSGLFGKSRLLYSKPLAVFLKIPLLSKCWPFNLPTLGPASTSAAPAPALDTSSATLLPTEPALPPSSSAVVVATPLASSQIVSPTLSSSEAPSAIPSSPALSSSEAPSAIPPSPALSSPEAPSAIPSSPALSSSEVSSAIPDTPASISSSITVSTPTLSTSGISIGSSSSPLTLATSVDTAITSAVSDLPPPYPTGHASKPVAGSLGAVTAPGPSGAVAPYPIVLSGTAPLPVPTGTAPLPVSKEVPPSYANRANSEGSSIQPDSCGAYVPSSSNLAPYPTSNPSYSVVAGRKLRIRRET